MNVLVCVSSSSSINSSNSSSKIRDPFYTERKPSDHKDDWNYLFFGRGQRVSDSPRTSTISNLQSDYHLI